MKEIYLITSIRKTVDEKIFVMYLNTDGEWDNEFNDAMMFEVYDDAVATLNNVTYKGLFQIEKYLTNQ